MQLISVHYFQIKKKKNISRDAFGSQLGRIHMQKQNLDQLQIRKVKALKRKSQNADETPASSKKSKKAAQEAET